MLKRVILAILVIVNSGPVSAEVLIQGADVSRLDYRAALKADPNAEPPSEVYLRAHPLGSRRDELQEKFAEAQRLFIEGSRAQASEKFSALAAMLTVDDWGAVDRAIFVQAYLRLAQLENDPVKQREYLAHSLSVGEADVDKALYPPPLLRQREILAGELPRVKISESAFAEGWTAVLINGRVCRSAECLELPATSTEVRVTYLSEQWVPYSKVISAREAGELKPKRVAWYEGACGSLKFHPEVQTLGERRTVCERGTAELNLVPRARVQAGNEVPRLDLKQKDVPFYKNGWFWTGVGVAVVAAIVINSRTQEDREPTTTYGGQ